jgi:dTDP-4-dehydrorhamnose 3,5-epimerase
MILKKHKKTKDHRGFFSKLISEKLSNKLKKIKEINLSYTKKKGTIRGLHYQEGKFKETKVIFVIKGKILDISVNLKNYKVKSKILCEKKNNFLIIPENFAHGFQTLEDNTIIIYANTQVYKKKFEKILSPFNENLKIKWPIKKYIISKKDARA